MLLPIAYSKICGKEKPSAIVILVIVICLLLSFDRPLKSRAQGPGMSGGDTPISTPWRPSKKDAKYAGPQACAKCDAEVSAKQHLTALGPGLEPVAPREVVASNAGVS